MKKLYAFIISGLCLFFSSCSDDDSETACTLEFRTIGVTVKGDSLTNFYTVTNFNSDTIKLDGPIDFGLNLWYPILSDTYHPKIKNSVEMFRFIGLINDSIVIDQAYTIEGDECHINRLEGPNEIEL